MKSIRILLISEFMLSLPETKNSHRSIFQLSEVNRDGIQISTEEMFVEFVEPLFQQIDRWSHILDVLINDSHDLF